MTNAIRNYRMFERMEPRLMLSASGFVDQLIYRNVSRPLGEFADLDGDGDLDILAASTYEAEIVWFENTDGIGNFRDGQPIEGVRDPTASVAIIDFDKDGDLDILTATSGKFGDNEATATWHENRDGRGDFAPGGVLFPLQVDVEPEFAGVEEAFAVADFDQDGDHDIATSVGWHENLGDATFRMRQSDVNFGTKIIATDLNGDGSIDIVSAAGSELAPAVVRFHLNDNNGRFDGGVEIAPLINGTRQGPGIRQDFDVQHADIDGDGDEDIMAMDTQVLWYENRDASEQFGPEQSFSHSRYVAFFPADIDGDGRVDVIVDDGTEVSWLWNNGRSDFEFAESIGDSLKLHFGLTNRIRAGDFDGDGDMDVLTSSGHCTSIPMYCSSGGMLLFENLNGAGTFGEYPVWESSPFDGLRSTEAADIDGDGDIDLFADTLQFGWFENVDGQLVEFSPLRSGPFENTNLIEIVDIDLDSDPDIVVSSTEGDFSMAWIENVNGTFSTRIPIDFGSQNRVLSVAAIDIDGDGDLDIVSGQSGDDRRFLVAYENDDSEFEAPIEVSSVAADDLQLEDWDRDGDEDIVAYGFRGINVFLNQDSIIDFENPILVSRTDTNAIEFGDIDGDGDRDLIVAGAGLHWYESSDGGPISDRHTLSPDQKFETVNLIDIDHDGDLDVLVMVDATEFGCPKCHKVDWYENVDGKGSFSGPRDVQDKISLETDVAVADFDRDGLDEFIITFSRNAAITLYDRALTGDANYDGVFDSSDLVQVFQANEYEDEIPGNSTWEEGDWNGDGDFDSSDLVTAFRAATYVATAKPNEIVAAIESIFDSEESGKSQPFVP